MTIYPSSIPGGGQAALFQPALAKTTAPRGALQTLDPFLMGGFDRVLGEAFFQRLSPNLLVLYGLIFVTDLNRLQAILNLPVACDVVSGAISTDQPLLVRRSLVASIGFAAQRLLVGSMASPERAPSWQLLDVTLIQLKRTSGPVNGYGAAEGGGIITV